MRRVIEIDDLLHDLRCNHAALNRPTSIYSRAISEIIRSHEFIREVAWRFSDHAAANWSPVDVRAHVADFLGLTMKQLDNLMENVK